MFPSLRENLPVVLLEAMAAGCAIVATDLPGNVEAVGDAARLVAVGDPVALREAVVELVAQPQMRRTLGAAARRRAVEEFGPRSWRRAISRGSARRGSRPVPDP